MKIDTRYLALVVALIGGVIVFGTWLASVTQALLAFHRSDAELIRRYDTLYAELKSGRIQVVPASEAQRVRAAVRSAALSTETESALLNEQIEQDQDLFHQALFFFGLQVLWSLWDCGPCFGRARIVLGRVSKAKSSFPLQNATGGAAFALTLCGADTPVCARRQDCLRHTGYCVTTIADIPAISSWERTRIAASRVGKGPMRTRKSSVRSM